MIKISLIISNLNGGGSEKVFALLSSELAENPKFEVSLILITKGEIIYPLSKSVKIIHLDKNRVLCSPFAIIKSLKKIRPHIVLTTLTYVNTFIGGIHFLIKKDYRLIARESTIPSINNRSKFKNLIQKIAYTRFDKIVCQSIAMANDLETKFNINKDKIITINNPVAIPNLFQKTELVKTPILIIVSMLRKEKGIIRVLKALSKVEIPFKCEIYGEGPELGNLKQFVADLKFDSQITFMGLCKDRESLNNAFNKASATLFGSFYEGFPNVVLESLATGTPVLAFPCKGGLEEIIKPNIGIIAQDEINFTRLINEKFWTSFNPNDIREITLKRFGTKNIINKYENLIEKQCAELQES